MPIKVLAASDLQDAIKLNIPLLIRMLEHAREDIKSDAELHEFVERILSLSKKVDTLTMAQWPGME